MTELVNSPVVHTLAWTLAHSLWQAAVIALAALALMHGLPASAARRHAVGAVALGAMLLSPVATFAILQVSTASLAEQTRVAAGAPTTMLVMPPGAAGAFVEPPAGQSWAAAIPVLAWVAGVIVFALRLLGGWVVVRRLGRRAVRPASDGIQALASRMALRLGLRRAVAILESSAVAVPLLVGSLKPVIVMPVAALAGLSAVQVEALLAHELAHVRRHDFLVNVLQSIVEVLLFYHPAVWWLSRRVRTDRELACDDLTVGLCDRLVYATALADVAELAGPRLAVAATGGDLLARVQRLLAAEPACTPAPVRWAPAVLLAVAGAILLPVSMAAGPAAAGHGAAPSAAADPAADTPLPLASGEQPAIAERQEDAADAGSDLLAAPKPDKAQADHRLAASALRLRSGQAGPPYRSNTRLTDQQQPVQQTPTEADRARQADQGRERAAVEQAWQIQIEEARRRVAQAHARFNVGILSSTELQKVELELARLQARGNAAAEQELVLAALRRHLEDLKVMAERGTASAQNVASVEAEIARVQLQRKQSADLVDARYALQSARLELERAAQLREKGLITSGAFAEVEARVRVLEHQLQEASASQQTLEQRNAEIERRQRVLREVIETQRQATVVRGVPALTPEADHAKPIAAGDFLSITLAGEPDLPPTYEVKADGTIRLVFLGTFPVVGQTVSQVRETIGRRMAERRLGSVSDVTVTLQHVVTRVRRIVR